MMQAASDALSDNAVYTRDVATADAVTPLVAKEDVDSGSSWHGKRASNAVGLVSVLLLSLGFLATAFLSFTHKDPAQASQCEMAWMSPSYLRLNGFNESHSRLASKYSLWFYREQGYDLSNKPHGVPVLFAPGNAGSYRQVRSLAAEAARSFYEKPGVPRASLVDAGHLELDWFAADFNEDFSAFHAATLREQAEYLSDAIRYILSLYGSGDASRPAPTSVVLVAHSMGGIASRLALLQPAFAPGSVKTILTLSTPHSMPPAAFDGGIERVYLDVNDFWSQSYAQSSSSLEDVLLVSIAGGTADTTVSSDYSGISSFTPSSNGFAVLTSSVPFLFSPVDHLAMVWCDQLRKSVAGALLRTTSANSPDRARALTERLQVMREYLLTGLEAPAPMGGLSSSGPPSASSSYTGHAALSGHHAAQTVEIRKLEGSRSSRLTVWTSIDTEGDRSRIVVHLCNGSDNKQGCKTLERPIFRRIPASTAATKDGTALPLYYASSLYLVRPVGQEYASVVLEIPAMEDGFLVASLAEQEDREITASLLRLAIFGSTARLPVGVLASDLRYSTLDTSLLAYRVTVKSDCQSAMPPLLRVHATDLHESLFIPDPEAPLVFLHSSPPFLPSTPEVGGLVLQFWRDPSCSAEVHIRLDWFASVGKLVLRYRSLIAAWPVAIVLLILQTQLQAGLTFDEAFRAFVARQLPIISMVGVGVAAVQSLASTIGLFHYRPIYTALLGNQHVLFLPLAPLFLVTASGVTYACHIVVHTVLGLLAMVWSALVMSGPRRLARNPTFTNLREQWVKTRIATFAGLALLILVFAPHQFAFMVLLLVQFDTTLRARVIGRQSKNQDAQDRFERNYTLLFLMLLLLPQNGSILLVWSRNLLAGWYAPFPSDHNVLAIGGYLLLVEYGQTGKILRHSKLSSFVIYPCAAGVLLYGARYAFIASIAANLVFLSLYVVQWRAATSP